MMQKTRQKTATKREPEEVEEYFFKYAFPCAQVKVKLGSLRKEEYDRLKEIFLQNSCPDKETLEAIFQAAFRRLGKLAGEMKKDVWDSDVLKEYWEKNHNEVIDEGEGMYGSTSSGFKELCKIHEAEVVEKHKDAIVVRYCNKLRAVSNFLVPDADVGDKVRIHFAYAVEKVK
ncbi:hypothetical protein A3K73_01270 [Candidatus Pacearchaeota archaeon RBG_13_36_9]|nr:MAG: hypothetical protein A3K73_01270 [Candidatus Pacearchaeota archaeon RBG_13_36_9]